MSGQCMMASTGHGVIPKYVLCVWLLYNQMIMVISMAGQLAIDNSHPN